MQREYITDEALLKILKFLSKHPGVYIGKPEGLRLFIEAIYARML